MEHYQEYKTLAFQFDKYITDLNKSFAKTFKGSALTSTSLNSKEFSDMVFGVLEDNNWDSTAFKLSWNSVKLETPSVLYKDFLTDMVSAKNFSYESRMVSSLQGLNKSDAVSLLNKEKRIVGALKKSTVVNDLGLSDIKRKQAFLNDMITNIDDAIGTSGKVTLKGLDSIYPKRVTNLLTPMNSITTRDKVVKSIKTNVSPLLKRVKRLESYTKNISVDSIKSQMHDVKRTIKTISTKITHIDDELKQLKTLINSKRLSTADVRQLKKDFNALSSTRKTLVKSDKDLTKQLNKFNRKSNTYSDKKLEREYVRLLNATSKNITTKQIPIVTKTSIRKATSHPKVTAQTQLQNANHDSFVKKANKKGEKVYVKISLNPARTWKGSDICDMIAENGTGFGIGVYVYGTVDLPPYHSSCGCDMELITIK